jgi:hypothetical protein
MNRLMVALLVMVAPAMTVVAAPSGVQAPGEQVSAACLRHDFSEMNELAKVVGEAIEAEDLELLKRTANTMRQCLVFQVAFRSTIKKTVGETVTTITGTGTATVRLGPDIQDAGYDFVTRVDGYNGPVVWSGISIKTKDCQIQVVPSPPTPFNFWLGMSLGSKHSGEIVVGPEGSEMHLVTANCSGQSGLPELPGMPSPSARGLPTPTPLFGDAWAVLYGGIEPTADPEEGYVIPLTVTAAPGQAVVASYIANRTKQLPGAQGTVSEQTQIIVTHTPGAPVTATPAAILVEP